MGLVSAHGYSVIKAVVYKDLHFLRIRNPWGNSEWKGDWSDDSSLWNERKDVADALGGLEKIDDGAFWMERNDFFKYGNKRLAMIYLTTEEQGFSINCVDGIITPEMFGNDNLCWAVHVTMKEDGMLFFSPDITQARYTEEDMRCHAMVYRAKYGRREESVFNYRRGGP
jgi:hypothetical protein